VCWLIHPLHIVETCVIPSSGSDNCTSYSSGRIGSQFGEVHTDDYGGDGDTTAGEGPISPNSWDPGPKRFETDCAGILPHDGINLSYADIEKAVRTFQDRNLCAVNLAALLLAIVTGPVPSPARSL
jgi:hypothetical protein